MSSVLKTMLVGLLLVSSVALKTDDIVAAPEPTTVGALASELPSTGMALATSFAPVEDPAWCFFCERYEGQEEHPETMQMVNVVYAYCGDYPMGGGGTICDEPINDWYWDVGDEWIWVGDTCQLQDYNQTSPFGDPSCDCSWVSHIGWPSDATTIDNCWLPTPAAAMAADGFSADVQTARVTEGESLGIETTCTGVISTFAFSETGAKTKRRNQSLVL